MEFQEFSFGDFVVMNTQLKHLQGVYNTVRLAYDIPLTEECVECIPVEDGKKQLERFPEGQFVAVYKPNTPEEKVAGVAATMRLADPPKIPAHRWMEALGDMGISNHDPKGEWLYGVEMSVRPEFRKQGIGTALYEARFDLVRRLNLRGWYAGGMLMGYERYMGTMTVQEYGEKVISGEFIDPTVTMQMNRGFEAWGVIEDYLDEYVAGNGAVLIVWKNPDYKEVA